MGSSRLAPSWVPRQAGRVVLLHIVLANQTEQNGMSSYVEYVVSAFSRLEPDNLTWF